MPRIADLIKVFSPLRAKLICDGQTTSRLVPVGGMISSFASTAPTGFLPMAGGTIGNASSGASVRANADTQELFLHLWNNLANAQAAVSSGRGASAAADFAAGKTITIPDARARSPLGKAASGTGSTIGDTGGAIDHSHSVPAHYHGLGTGADLAISASGSHTHAVGTNVWDRVVTGGSVSLATPAGVLDQPVAGLVSAAATHTHATGDFTGRVGLVTGGVNGNAEMTSGTANHPFLVMNFFIAY